MSRNTVTITDLEQLIGNYDRKPIEITADLCQLEGRPISLSLIEWELHDWRPRDEWFQIEAIIVGTAHRLKLFPSPHEQLDTQSIQ